MLGESETSVSHRPILESIPSPIDVGLQRSLNEHMIVDTELEKAVIVSLASLEADRVVLIGV